MERKVLVGGVEMFDSPFFRLDLSASLPRCEVCRIRTGLLSCKSCRIGCYCSKDCQNIAWKKLNHKLPCKKLNHLWEHYEREEKYLQHNLIHQPHVNYFQDQASVGSFWSIVETRPYITALYTLAWECYQYNTILSLKQALSLFMKLLYYDRKDHKDASGMIVNALISLGYDQWAYDFIKFWAFKNKEGVDYSDVTAPYLSDWEEDLSETSLVECDSLSLSHSLALVLLKIRYYDQCVNYEKFVGTFLVGTHQSFSILSLFREKYEILKHIYFCLFPAKMFHHRVICSSSAIYLQIYDLMNFVDSKYPILWRALIHPNKITFLPRSILSVASDMAGLLSSELEKALPCWERNPSALLFVEHQYCHLKYQGKLEYSL